jgi:hypothetical protein
MIWEEWVRILVAAAASLTALGVIWTKAIKPMVDGIATIAERVKVLETLAERASALAVLAADAVVLVDLPARLDVVEASISRLQGVLDRMNERTKTLEPNGGTSIADRVERIDKNTQAIKGD